jgi:hypothetical protein
VGFAERVLQTQRLCPWRGGGRRKGRKRKQRAMSQGSKPIFFLVKFFLAWPCRNIFFVI